MKSNRNTNGMTGDKWPILIGLEWDEATAIDVQNKGWFEQAQLKLYDGTLLPLSFWDPVRLSQELMESFASGRKFFAERNLIILPQSTEAAIRDAVEVLVSSGYFGH